MPKRDDDGMIAVGFAVAAILGFILGVLVTAAVVLPPGTHSLKTDREIVE